MKKALIVIDLQNDYFYGGNMELQNIDEVLQKTNKLITFARKQNYQVYFIQHFSTREGATFFVPNTRGVELNDKLDIKNEMIIEKKYPNSFRDTKLKEELDKKNIKNLIICGAMTHMCIDTTVRAGFDLGYNITLVDDACATRNLQFKDTIIKAKDVHNSFMAALDNIFCEIKNTNELTSI